MIEPLFVQVPPVWTGPAPWPSGWLPQPAGMSSLSMPTAATVGALAPQAPVGSAAQLVAAVALRRGQPNGPTTDQDVEELIYDTLELLPGATDVEARCEGGRLTLSGTVSHKRLKRDIGEIAWSIPSLVDVMNTLTITSRRRTRGFAREAEGAGPPAAGRKQA
jgi:hypothetical protein